MERRPGMNSQGLPYHNQLNKRPTHTYILWAAKTGDKEYSGFTWGALNKVIRDVGDILTEIVVCDLDDATVTKIPHEDAENFLEAWRAHYYDSNWKEFNLNLEVDI